MQSSIFQKIADQSLSMSAEDGQWMTPENASKYTGLSEQTIGRSVRRRSLKYRRDGKKVEIWIAADMKRSPDPDSDPSALDDLFESDQMAPFAREVETIEVQGDLGYATRETLQWLRESVDEKDKKILALSEEIAGANFRNGYLESQVNFYQDQIKLLEDRQGALASASFWSKFMAFIAGKKKQ